MFMRPRLLSLSSMLVLSTLMAAPVAAQTRTPWQMHDGLEVTPSNPLGLVDLTCAPAVHGDVCEYDDATIPPGNDTGWGPAPNGETIGLDFFCGQSRVCSAPIGCLAYADFTYFQTLVTVPADVLVTQFTIDFSGMDDGSRVSIFNSAHPGGFVVPGSFVFLGGSGTTNLAALVVAGEENRVVVTQVDDCCCDNNLHVAQVVLNGEVIDTGCDGPADCSDGDACTDDVCNEDGSCSNPEHSCDDGDACTLDRCDPALGCGSEPQCPDCGDAAASVASIWPPNHKLVAVGVEGLSDPQNQALAVTIDDIAQDERTNGQGDGNTCPDADGIGTDTAWVRAERTGTPRAPGNGRVYTISFTATDPDGNACSGAVSTCVPHDQGRGRQCVDEGPLHDSLVCE
jgi:hypothetical protein